MAEALISLGLSIVLFVPPGLAICTSGMVIGAPATSSLWIVVDRNDCVQEYILQLITAVNALSDSFKAGPAPAPLLSSYVFALSGG